MAIYHQLERKFGHLGIPGLIKILACFRLLVWILGMVNPDFVGMLFFDRERILSGEVWRLASFILVPKVGTSSFSGLYALIEVMFLFFISDGLEQAWRPFGVTLYLVSSAVLGVLVCLLFPLPLFTHTIFLSLLFAFACLYPNVEILLFLVIPIKMKYVGWLSAGFLAFSVASVAQANLIVAIILALPVLAMLLPFFIVFAPPLLRGLQQQGKVAARRNAFEKGKRPAIEAFHKCTSCGATEVSEPEREFRIRENGEEYCDACQP